MKAIIHGQRAASDTSYHVMPDEQAFVHPS